MVKQIRMTYVYDYKLMDFLKERGIKHLCTGLAVSNYRQFWQYPDNEELSNAIDDFKRIKKNAA